MSCEYHSRLDHIARYVREELNEDEQEKFEEHYLGCDACLQSLKFVQKTAVTMQHYGASIFAPQPIRHFVLSDNWVGAIKTWWDDLPISAQWKSAAPAFAMYLLLIGALSLGYHFSSKIKGHSLPHESDATLSGGTNTGFSLQHLPWTIAKESAGDTALFNRLTAIQANYQKQQYALAADRLVEVVRDFPGSNDARLFLGINQLHNDQTPEASANLNEVLKSNPDDDAALWYLAQSYVKESRLVEARQPLGGLVKQKNSFYYPKAVALLDKIKKLQ